MTVRLAVAGAVLAVIGGALVVGLPASQRAPSDPGLCWTVTALPHAKAKFTPLDQNIDNAETCGARLEAVRMLQGGPVSGAFGGAYLFADDEGITIAPTLEGPRRELISAKDRQRVDMVLAELIRQRAARDGITVEKIS